MRIAICHVSDAARTRVRPALQITDATTAQFGWDTVVLGDDASWPAVQEAVDQEGIRLEELRVASANDLHVVVQSGRSFQQEHQDVRVLLDKGRILLVDLDREQAAVLANRADARAHYGIRPLLDDAVAFETRERPAARSAPVPWVQALVDRLSPITFRADLSHLAAFPTRFSDSTHYAEASLWAQGQLSAMGYAARREGISAGGRESFNVIADKPGSGPDHRSLVIVTAHLDSINEAGPSKPAPGADDNASGSAGLLEIARALQDHEGTHDLRLVLFGLEEQGLHGSKQYVDHLSDTDRERIVAVVNMDMIGTLNTASPTVLLEGATVSKVMMDGLEDAALTYSDLIVQRSLTPFASDHVSFIDVGLPAVLTIEGADRSNHHVHTAADILAHVSDDLALAILRMNTAFVAQTLGQA